MRRIGLGLAVALIAAVSAVAQTARDEAGTAPAFDAALAAAKELPLLHSLLVSWRGDIVLERYYNGATATRPANVKSVAKSVISALVGIAVDRRLITDVDTPIATYFPELTRDARKATITVEDLLTMRSGLESTSNRNYGAWVLSRNWVQFALTRPLVAEPGSVMDYSTGNSHLLSAILTKVTRTTTWQFANDTLARPLGFTLTRWPRDPQGIYFGGNDMLLTPRQMVAFGELYLRDGRIDGRQILPERWIERSWVGRDRSSWSGQMYGYGWWIRDLAGRRAYYAWGFGGQYIFVIPELDLVVVTTSSPTVAEDRRSHRRTLFELVEDLVVAPIAARGES